MNIKEAIVRYMRADTELMSVFKRIYKVFNPISSAQLNKSIIQKIFPHATVVEVQRPVFNYCENGLLSGPVRTSIQIDFMQVLDMSRFTAKNPAERDKIDAEIENFDNVVDKFILKMSQLYGTGKPLGMPEASPVSAIRQLILTEELGTQEEIDSALIKNSAFNRKVARFSVLYDPILNET